MAVADFNKGSGMRLPEIPSPIIRGDDPTDEPFQAQSSYLGPLNVGITVGDDRHVIRRVGFKKQDGIRRQGY